MHFARVGIIQKICNKNLNFINENAIGTSIAFNKFKYSNKMPSKQREMYQCKILIIEIYKLLMWGFGESYCGIERHPNSIEPRYLQITHVQYKFRSGKAYLQLILFQII